MRALLLFLGLLFGQKAMKVAVWDTYVQRKDGRIMHFDIIVPAEVTDTAQIFAYGRAYLATKGEAGQPLTARNCRFCHIETVRPAWEKAIRTQGYAIHEMENCD
ncbi:MAG: hypothetical protein KatS3mg025_0029 [Bacteroidia bacterium]|jgi:hypothetical protein|nr:MAG: hypothetical protein KatS3mg025_0029 [Bacteroidia bacterium]